MPPEVSLSANSWNGRISGRIGVSATVLRLLGSFIPPIVPLQAPLSREWATWGG